MSAEQQLQMTIGRLVWENAALVAEAMLLRKRVEELEAEKVQSEE